MTLRWCVDVSIIDVIDVDVLVCKLMTVLMTLCWCVDVSIDVFSFFKWKYTFFSMWKFTFFQLITCTSTQSSTQSSAHPHISTIASTSTHQHINTRQHINTLAHYQRTNTSTHQDTNTVFNTSKHQLTHQHINLHNHQHISTSECVCVRVCGWWVRECSLSENLACGDVCNDPQRGQLAHFTEATTSQNT
jgi:hypothetical protein